MTTVVPPVVAHLGEDFLAQVYGRTYRHVPGEPGRFSGFLRWNDLNALLTHHRLEPPRLRLSIDGETLPQHSYTVPVTTRRNTVWHQLRPAELHRHLADGATLVLDAVDELHPGVGEFARQLERHLRTGVQVNAYASWTSEEGFGVHWDDHDVLVLQVDGAKRWRIYGPTRQAPSTATQTYPNRHRPSHWSNWCCTPGTCSTFPAAGGTRSPPPRASTPSTSPAACRPRPAQTCSSGSPKTYAGKPLYAATFPVSAPLRRRRTSSGFWAIFSRRCSVTTAWSTAFSASATPPSVPVSPSLPYVEGVPADPGIVVRLVTARARLERDGENNAVLVAGGEEWAFASQAAPLLALLVEGGSHRLDTLAQSSGIRIGQAALLVSQLVDGELATAENTE